MASFLDFYGPPQTFTGQDPVVATSLTVPDIGSVESGVWLSGLVILVPSVDTTEIAVRILRGDQRERVITTVPVLLPAAIVDPQTFIVPIEGVDGPGLSGEAGYTLQLIVNGATGDTTVSVANLHARYNEPYALLN